MRAVCDNRLTVRRSKLERLLLGGLCDRLLEPGVVSYALRRVADEITKLSGEVAGMSGRKQAELDAARKRLENLVEFVACGKVSDSFAIAGAIAEAESRVSRLQVEADALRNTDGPAFEVPSETWIVERVAELQALLERRTQLSAQVLRGLLGQVVLEAVRPDSGAAYYVAHTSIDTFALIDPSGPQRGPDGGSGPLRWWTRNDSIRTLARSPFELDLYCSEPPRVYKQIAAEAASMRAQGARLSVISRHFGVDPRTVQKALRWSRERRVR